MNRQQFLQTKFGNFVAFLRTGLAKLPPAQSAHAEGFLAQYEKTSPHSLIALIVHFATYKSNLSAAVDRILVEAHLPKSAFTEAELQKMELYIEMFIDVVCA